MFPSIPRKSSVAASVAALSLLTACGGATRHATAPQKPGTAALTGAKVAPTIERVLIADRGVVSMVERDGCVASVTSAELEAGATDELRVRCPQSDRLTQWFQRFEALTANAKLERIKDSDEEKSTLPAAELVTTGGHVLRVVDPKDAQKLAADVRALTAELAAAEVPGPGPATAAGWQMVRVSGPAHVVFAGSPTKGVLDARVSTTGQYFCEFLANTDDGPLRATKSGWIEPQTASRAIDEVLVPFQNLGDGEKAHPTFASGFTADGERKASSASTAAVFERFAPIQDALGDACLPELDPPATQSTF